MNKGKKITNPESKIFNIGIFSSLLTLLLFSFIMVAPSSAQTPAGLASGSFPAGNGPTAAPQSGRLLLNTSGTTYATPTTTVQATATISNQQYSGVGTGTGNPVAMFGATNNNSGTTPTSLPTYAAMNNIGSPSNTQFSNSATGAATGIDVATNQAFNMYTSVQQWGNSTTPSTNNVRIYMADLTVTFSTPLTNPLMQIVGLGGTYGNLGFTTGLDLTTPGLSMTKVQGNSTLLVSATQIKNANTSGITASCATGGAACGTIQINGTRIQSVSFKIFIRGDGGNTVWSDNTVHAGDQWLLGFSLPKTWTVSGKVFNDANGLSDNTVNGTGTGTVAGVQLYANLVEPSSGKVIGSATVNADGTYSFNGVPDGANVRVEISTNQGTALSNAPSKALPANWSNTGENIGTGAGSDGTPNGAISTTVSSNVTNVDLGISNLGPTAADVTVGGRVTTATGRGIRNVVITMTDSQGNQRRTTSTSFGYYRFADVPSGETYVITASAKRFTFSQPTQVLNIIDDTDGVDFIANPQPFTGLGEKPIINQPF